MREDRAKAVRGTVRQSFLHPGAIFHPVTNEAVPLRRSYQEMQGETIRLTQRLKELDTQIDHVSANSNGTDDDAERVEIVKGLLAQRHL